MTPVLSGFLEFWDALWAVVPNGAPTRAERSRVAAKLNGAFGVRPVRLDLRESIVAASLTAAECPAIGVAAHSTPSAQAAE